MKKILSYIAFTIIIIVSIALLNLTMMAKAATADHVVISEIQTSGGTGKTTDEFIELYNPTGTAVSLNGWSLVKKTATGNDYVLIADFGGKSIPANGFFLAAHPTGYAGVVAPDAVYSTTNSISDNNTVLLLDSSQNSIDEVGWGTATVSEGTAAANPAATKSLERKAKSDSTADYMIDGGRDYFAGNGEDSGNNQNDFIIQATPEPQNSLSEPEFVTAAAPTVPVTNVNSAPLIPAPVTANTNNTNLNANTATMPTNQRPVSTDTLVPTPRVFDYSKKVFINEALPSCAGPDDACEFVELVNNDDHPIQLAGWSLTDQKTIYYFSDSAVIDVGEFLVIDHQMSKITLNNTGDTLYLIDPAKAIVHGVTYGKAKEDVSFSRTDDGQHWQWTAAITAGGTNEFSEEEDSSAVAPVSAVTTAGLSAEQSTAEMAVSQDPTVVDILGITESLIGKTVIVSGQVDSISGRSFYVVDEEGNSIRVYVSKKPGLETLPVKAGDTVTITGEVSKTDAGLRIVPRSKDDIVVAPPESAGAEGQVLGTETTADTIVIPQRQSSSQAVMYIVAAGAVTIGAVAVYIWKTRAKEK
ncbi:MAG: lamin tail domain-containing protein [Patescibacteria group bacterium]